MKHRSISREALLGVAVTGLLAGALGSSCTVEKSEAPAATAQQNANPAAMGLPEHACKTYNDCAKKGGCKTGDNGCAGKNSCKGKGGCATAEKHACKGANACKGQGGCKSGDNGCAGKNSCKGKGGCAVPVKH